MSHAVEIRGLSKHYRNVIALSDLTLDVNGGEIFGVIGPNGAGKSTALKIITTLLKPTSGSVNVFGLDAAENPQGVREIISYLPEEAGSYKQLTGREYLEFMAGFFGNREGLDETIERGVRLAGLAGRIDDRTKEYSKGMKRRLLIARTLMTKPRLAVMDEAASGLDVKHAYYVRGIIRDYVENMGVTVLLSSHNMLEVEHLCHRVALIDMGHLIEVGTPKEIMARYEAANLEEAFIRATSAQPFESGGEQS